MLTRLRILGALWPRVVKMPYLIEACTCDEGRLPRPLGVWSGARSGPRHFNPTSDGAGLCAPFIFSALLARCQSLDCIKNYRPRIIDPTTLLEFLPSFAQLEALFGALGMLCLYCLIQRPSPCVPQRISRVELARESALVPAIFGRSPQNLGWPESHASLGFHGKARFGPNSRTDWHSALPLLT